VKERSADLSEKINHRDITNNINEDCQPNKKLDFKMNLYMKIENESFHFSFI